MGLKIYSAPIFSFCSSYVTTFPTCRKCKYFNFAFHTVPAEMLYLQKYLTNFQKLFFSERRGTCLLLLKISTAQIFSFSNSNVTTFPSSRKCKYFNFAFHTVPAEMLYLLKCLTNFVKSFFRLKEEEPGYWVWKFTVRRYFRFAVARLQLFQHAENVNISILHFPLSQQKCYISRSF